MSAVDGADVSVVTDPLDTKAGEEERYRLKMVALQECYDSVALQSIRLRERIYQVRKQCRRLEVMKRVALNMLHQNTGTYDIPPLEIVDEDPLPSFLESLHKQQHVVAEPPRKKSKRPSRSKSDGKLTPEEEERAKQKIYSIIDSVYSETARRMGDASKKPPRNPSMMTPTSLEDCTRKVPDLPISSSHSSTGESHTKTFLSELESRKPEKEASLMPLNGERDASVAEEHESNSLANLDTLTAGYESLSTSEESMAYEATLSIKSTYQNTQAGSSSLGLTYRNNDCVQDLSCGASTSSSPTYEASLDTLQPMNYHVDGGGLAQHISRKSLDYDTHREENGSVYNLSNSVSPAQNHHNNIESGHIGVYHGTAISTKPLLYVSEHSSERAEHLLHRHSAPNHKTTVSSPAHHVDGEKVNIVSDNGDSLQPLKKNKLTARVDAKQDTSKAASTSPLPNFIPYRMIEVVTPKPVEVITIDSGDETSSPKQVPKRRRKYKYVVESVLDNVPYTFRQAESDDEEVADKQSTTISTPVRTSN